MRANKQTGRSAQRLHHLTLRVLLLLLTTGSLTAVGADSPTPCTPTCPAALTNVPYHCQEHEAWCWAACAEMIMGSFGVHVEQCQQVNLHATKDCCPEFPEEDMVCNILNLPHFEHYGFTVTTNDFPLTWEQIQEQIYCKHAPFAWSWIPTNSPAGHMVVVIGYKVVDGVNMLDVYDPEPWCGDPDRDLWRRRECVRDSHLHNTSSNITGATDLATQNINRLLRKKYTNCTGSVTIPAGQPTGQNYFIAVCDVSNTVVEANENNNTNVVPVTVN